MFAIKSWSPVVVVGSSEKCELGRRSAAATPTHSFSSSSSAQNDNSQRGANSTRAVRRSVCSVSSSTTGSSRCSSRGSSSSEPSGGGSSWQSRCASERAEEAHEVVRRGGVGAENEERRDPFEAISLQLADREARAQSSFSRVKLSQQQQRHHLKSQQEGGPLSILQLFDKYLAPSKAQGRPARAQAASRSQSVSTTAAVSAALRRPRANPRGNSSGALRFSLPTAPTQAARAPHQAQPKRVNSCNIQVAGLPTQTAAASKQPAKQATQSRLQLAASYVGLVRVPSASSAQTRFSSTATGCPSSNSSDADQQHSQQNLHSNQHQAQHQHQYQHQHRIQHRQRQQQRHPILAPKKRSSSAQGARIFSPAALLAASHSAGPASASALDLVRREFSKLFKSF